MEQEEPGLGAFIAPLNTTVVAGTAGYTVTGQAAFSPVTTPAGLRYNITGQMLLAQQMPPHPSPMPPQVQTVTPNPVASGGTITITGTGFAPGARVLWGTRLLPVTVVSPTSMIATAPVVFATTTAPLDVNVAGMDALGPPLTVLGGAVPPPVPANTIDVRTLGVKGDGATIDRTALTAAIQNAAPGTTLYFPSGTYLTDDALKVYRSDVSFLGDGDTSIIKSVSGSYHFQVGHGAQQYTGIGFSKLQFYGTPGQYMADGTARGGCLLFGCKGVSFTDCLFRGCAEPIVTAGAMGITYGTAATNCRFLGWGRMCIFCSGGERIANCQLIQDDPNLFGERSSHGFYIHSGSSDVVVQDTEIAGARKYAIQLYGENDPNPITGVQLLRLNIHDCENGIILAHGAATAGIATNCVIQGCAISGIYGGQGIAVKNGQGIDVSSNVISNGIGAGISMGVWAPYEPNFSLSDVRVTGNTVRTCDRGIWALDSNGGTFTNCVVTGNLVNGLGNRKDYDITGAGIVWAPGSTPTADGSMGTNPSDDRSRAAKALN